MDGKEALKILEAIGPEPRDEEVAHGDADDVLCALLESLGYNDVVRAWRAIPKWYA